MAFTGYAFVIFFAMVFGARWLLPPRATQPVLLFASVVFYLAWGWKLAVLLGALTAFTYGAGHLLRTRTERRKLILGVGIAVVLGTLAVFKYAELFASFVPGLKVPHLPLPLGISFYVFEMISYLIDVYRGDKGAKSLPEFLLYVSYFPHLIAGPIVRASELLPQLREKRTFDTERVSEGMFIMLTGFAKKMIIADNLGPYADAIFLKPESYNSLEILAGIAAYTGQIFCDFSGYTDIARGGSMMLGLDLPENFDYPYLSRSITEFWRRWHMTLSRWLRDYLYIPLGGNRGSELATYRNLFITMTLGGLWHGARLTFVIWGAYHGLLLAAHKLFTGATKSSPKWKAARENLAYEVLAGLFTLTLVMVGWVFFRATTFENALKLLQRLEKPYWPVHGWKPPRPVGQVGWYLAGLVALHAGGGTKLGLRTNRALPPAARGLFWAGIVVMLYLLASSSPTFIYFYF